MQRVQSPEKEDVLYYEGCLLYRFSIGNVSINLSVYYSL